MRNIDPLEKCINGISSAIFCQFGNASVEKQDVLSVLSRDERWAHNVFKYFGWWVEYGSVLTGFVASGEPLRVPRPYDGRTAREIAGGADNLAKMADKLWARVA
jgi:hypothetical protein